MLNGFAPIMIFNFKKLLPQADVTGVPLLSSITESVPLIPIPIYFDATLTGIHITSQNKNIDIKTESETLPDGEKPRTTQSGLSSVITINALANRDSLGLNIISAMMDVIFQKVTSKEYSISWVSGAITAFGCLLDGFSVQEAENSDLLHVSIQLSNAPSGSTADNGSPEAPTTLSKSTGTIPLGS